METLARWFPDPLPHVVAIVVAGLALYFELRSLRLCARALRSPGHAEQSRWMIRGIRDGILAIGFVCFAVGLWRFSAPWLVFGLVFLGEEILETGIMLLALRRKPSSP